MKPMMSITAGKEAKNCPNGGVVDRRVRFGSPLQLLQSLLPKALMRIGT